MTDLEVLQKCIHELGNINVPAIFIDQIGIPIYTVRQNLISLYAAVKKSEEKAQETVDDNIELTLSPDESSLTDD